MGYYIFNRSGQQTKEIIMEALNAIMKEAGITKEQVKKEILNTLEVNNIKLSEFSEDQKKRIITTYAAIVIKNHI